MPDADILGAALKLVLEPAEGQWVICRNCGAVKHSQDDHRCRAEQMGGEQVEAEGLTRDEKKRANSYGMG